MSRIIVKGLPDKITEEKLRSRFSEKGVITECTLKYNKDGVFRKFAFIGFKEAAMASAALKHFNHSFINTSKIQVSIASDMSEKNGKERRIEPWSKINKKSKESKVDNKDNNNNNNINNTNKRKNEKKTKNSDGIKTQWTVKVTGLAAGVKQEDIEKFFSPIPCHIQNAAKIKGKVVVFFESEKEKDEAMKRNKHYIGIKKVFLHKHTAPLDNNNNNNNNNNNKINNNNNNDDDEDSDDDDDDDDAKEDNKTDDKTSKPEDKSKERELIAETGRLFIKNLPYCTTPQEIEEHFTPFGQLEVQLQIDKHNNNKSKGFCLVNYVLPENALKAYDELDGTVFQGRMLHIVGGKARREDSLEDIENLPFNKKKEILKKMSASNVKSWNSLFVGGDAVAEVVARDNDVSKHELLMQDSDISVAAHLALEQTRIVNETRQFLLSHGVALDCFSQASAPRSTTVLLAKHLPAHTSVDQLEKVFEKFSQSVKRILLPPSGLTAIVEFSNPIDAANAFKTLAYTRFKHLPLYLEKAPMDIFKPDENNKNKNKNNKNNKDTNKDSLEFTSEDKKKEDDDDNDEDEEEDEEEEDEDGDNDDEEDDDDAEVNMTEARRSVYVRNMPAEVTEEDIRKEFKEYGSIVSVNLIKSVASGGASGFIEWGTAGQAEAFVRARQMGDFMGSTVELKISDRLVKNSAAEVARKLENKMKKDKKKKGDKGVTPKIIIRNVPFEASEKDLKQLLSIFPGVKALRLPKKSNNNNTGTAAHRGFAFVQFVNKTCSKRAFNQLCHNTALYGRRLNLQYCKSGEASAVGDDNDVEKIRKRTAEKYNPETPKKSKKSDLLDDISKLKH